jgi:hypothetical protein
LFTTARKLSQTSDLFGSQLSACPKSKRSEGYAPDSNADKLNHLIADCGKHPPDLPFTTLAQLDLDKPAGAVNHACPSWRTPSIFQFNAACYNV